MVAEQEAPPMVMTHGRLVCAKVRTSGRFKGDKCGELLARPRIEHWEQDLASEALQICPRCGEEYRLADYLRMR